MFRRGLLLIRDAAWAPAGVLLIHAVAGRLWGHEPYVDPVMHFLGGAAVAFFFRRAAVISEEILGAPSPLALDLVAFGLACTAALFWEFGELLSDLVLGSHIQVSAANTLRDLALGLTGAVVLLLTRHLSRLL